ncbi:MAG: hypothetical protein LBH06_10205 [Rikenellaceae bacterium]|jgi:opacity protein-like surface antigen|nr:hypothetical protein [Rikenellaceae bacterium]
MKKVISFVVLAAGLLLAVPQAKAQSAPEWADSPSDFPHHELAVGAGWITSDQFLSLAFKLGTSIVSLFSYSELESKYSQAYNIAYKYRFNKTISLGATFAHCADDAKCEFLWAENEQTKNLGTVKNTFNCFAAEMDIRYLTRKWVSLYATTGLGLTFASRKVTPTPNTADTNPDHNYDVRKSSFTYFNFQATPIGVKVGHPNFGGFAELGFGYKGLFNIGVYGRF